MNLALSARLANIIQTDSPNNPIIEPIYAFGKDYMSESEDNLAGL